MASSSGAITYIFWWEYQEMKLNRVLLAISVFTATGALRAADPPTAGALAGGASGGSTSSESATAEKSPWGWLAMPKVSMPKISMPKIEMPKLPSDPLAPVKSSAKKVSEGASKAWEGTKEIFTGGDKSAATAPKPAAANSPSLWQKMFGGSEKKEPEGPRTVSEWMAQPRLDP